VNSLENKEDNKKSNDVEGNKEKSKKILLVEDDDKFARVLSKQLEKNNYEVTHCATLSDSLDSLIDGKFDLVLLDLGLSDSSGLKTYDEISKVKCDIPVVVLTGLDDEKIAVGAVKKGAQDYLVKGEVDNRALLRSLEYAIERSKLLFRLKKLQELVLQSERIKVLVETAGAAAHGINQPLTSIFGMVELMKKDLPDDSPVHKKVDFIFQAASQIRDIIKKMGSIRQYTTKPYLKGMDIVDFEEASEDEE
jgi:ActR/RegA family two-component response regulator